MGSASVGGGREPEGGSKVVGQVGMIAVPELDSPCVSFLSGGLGNRCSRGCVEASLVAGLKQTHDRFREMCSARYRSRAGRSAGVRNRDCSAIRRPTLELENEQRRNLDLNMVLANRGRMWPVYTDVPSRPDLCPRAPKAGLHGRERDQSGTIGNAGRHGEALTRVISSGLFCRDDRI